MEYVKFLRTSILKNICERLLLKPVLSPGLPFFITYTCDSNWYLCFSFYIIIYSFVYLFSLHYYWYCYNQKQSSVDVLHKSILTNFVKIRKKTPALINTAKNIVISRNFLCGNFVKRSSFLKVSGDSSETMRKLCLSSKFPHQEIRWNYGILRNGTYRFTEFYFIKISHNTFFTEPSRRLLLHKQLLCLLSHHDLLSFKKQCHT